MTPEKIIELAREAGAGTPESLYGRTDYVVFTQHDLERFAALVAAHEREQCIKLCIPLDNRSATDPERYLSGAKSASIATSEAIKFIIQSRGMK